MRLARAPGQGGPRPDGRAPGPAAPPSPAPPGGGTWSWLHGASVGETLSLLPLVGAPCSAAARPQAAGHLRHRHRGPDDGQAPAGQRPASLRPRRHARPSPAASWNHWKPYLGGIFVESELWPSLLAQGQGARPAAAWPCWARGLSDGQRLGLGQGPCRKTARAPVGRLSTYSPGPGRGRRAETARPRRVWAARWRGNSTCKQAAAPPPCDEAALTADPQGRDQVDRRAVVVAASTHPGEDESRSPRPLRALAKRPRPCSSWSRAIRRREAATLRTMLRGPRGPQDWRAVPSASASSATPRSIWPTPWASLGLFFRVAQVVLMGGGFGDGVGGHNPLEPARLGLPVVTGPDVANFRETYAGLLAGRLPQVTPHQAALNAALGRRSWPIPNAPRPWAKTAARYAQPIRRRPRPHSRPRSNPFCLRPRPKPHEGPSGEARHPALVVRAPGCARAGHPRPATPDLLDHGPPSRRGRSPRPRPSIPGVPVISIGN